MDFHLPRLRGLCGASKVIVVEPSDQRRVQLQAKLGNNGISLVPDLPTSGHFSIAVVATPPKFHLGYVERLAGRCDQLLVEKPDRKSVVSGKSVSVRVELGGRRCIQKKKTRVQPLRITIII